jgi:hypothetical protein
MWHYKKLNLNHLSVTSNTVNLFASIEKLSNYPIVPAILKNYKNNSLISLSKLSTLDTIEKLYLNHLPVTSNTIISFA